MTVSLLVFLLMMVGVCQKNSNVLKVNDSTVMAVIFNFFKMTLIFFSKTEKNYNKAKVRILIT